MSQQQAQQKPPSKFPQYIAPIIILILAAGAAIYGVLWSMDESNNTASNDAATTDQSEQPAQPDNSAHPADVEQEFPEADASQHEALAAARSELELYVLSEHQLQLVLADPQFGYELEQDAIDFAVENVAVDWNEQAHQYAAATLNEFPDVEVTDLQEIMVNDPEGPQFTEEQTEYALSQLD
ncbi:hypothetical protein GCM10009720_01120 [Yaniella flava]|uniref:Host cell surface-exposed lipoprotein n=1 Tax=Yaniella flava TaxID=287930 RepID=A0ABP5FJ93_9MICC|nr:hypothetical protein [Micrococcaceae bacterium]